MKSLTLKFSALLITAIFMSVSLLGQWSDSPATNLAVSSLQGIQYYANVKYSAGGTGYISWFNINDAEQVKEFHLQSLDTLGYTRWQENGVIIDTFAYFQSFDQIKMLVDEDDCAIHILPSDYPPGTYSLVITRVNASGILMYGGTIHREIPYYLQYLDAAFIDPDHIIIAGYGNRNIGPMGYDSLYVQCIEKETGEFAWQDWLIIPGNSTDGRCCMPKVIPSGEGDFILLWLRNMSWGLGEAMLQVRKYDAAGNPLWNSAVQVCDGPGLYSDEKVAAAHDGSGGVALCWTDDRNSTWKRKAYFQHLSADGTELVLHNGMPLTAQSDTSETYPALSVDESSGEVTIFWITNFDVPAGTKFSVHGQRLTSSAEPAWGDNGIAFTEESFTYIQSMVMQKIEDDVAVIYSELSYDDPAMNRIRAMRVDASGELAWDPPVVEISGMENSKTDLSMCYLPSSQLCVAWIGEDNFDSPVFAQNIHFSGELGILVGISDPEALSETACMVFPNPFADGTNFTMDLPCTSQVELVIGDLAGRQVYRHVSSHGPGRAALHWDGKDLSGNEVPAGCYSWQATMNGLKVSGKIIRMK